MIGAIAKDIVGIMDTGTLDLCEVQGNCRELPTKLVRAMPMFAWLMHGRTMEHRGW